MGKKEDDNTTNSTETNSTDGATDSKDMKALDEKKKLNLTDDYIESLTNVVENLNYTMVGNVTIWNDSPLMYTEKKASDTNDTIIYYPIWAI